MNERIVFKHEKSWLRAQHTWPKTPLAEDRVKEIVAAQLAGSGRGRVEKEEPPPEKAG